MDGKAWLWKKKSTEKRILIEDTANLPINCNDEEKRLVDDEARHEQDLKFLNDKLSAALSECNARQGFAKKQANLAQEAIAGWEKAETEVRTLKLELEKSLQQRVASEEKLNLLDGALKECMQQLRFVREDQAKRICDAVKKVSKEFERIKMESDEKLAESTKRLANVEAESIRLSKVLMSKEKVIAELYSLKAQVEDGHAALLARTNSTEKENISLRYEVHVLQKELEIRNEEREFNCRTADASHKQHLENLKVIAKLESECHRLRLLVRKRLPGPAALTQMKNEVKLLGKDQLETTIKRSSSSSISSMDIGPETLTKQVDFPTEQSLVVGKGIKIVKEALNKTMDELPTSRLLHCHAVSSTLSHPEGSLGEDVETELGKNVHSEKELSLASMSDLGSDDKISCTGSWVSALISEIEQFKNGKEASKPSSISVGFSDMSLMDDFVQMEKLAVVSTGNPFESNNHAMQTNEASGQSINDPNRNAQEAPAPDVLPLHDQSNMSSSNDCNQYENGLGRAIPSSLAEMLQFILGKCYELQRNPSEMLEEIKAALPLLNHQDSQSLDTRETSKPYEVSCDTEEMLGESPVKSLLSGSSLMGTCDNIITAKNGNEKPHSSLSISMHKIIKLIELICMLLTQDRNSEMLSMKDDRSSHYQHSETCTGYVVRVFQWKSSELSAILEQFAQACSDFQNEKSEVEDFAEQITFTLSWVMDHCFSLQDVSSMKHALKSSFAWDERRESELDIGTINQLPESNNMYIREEEPLSSTFASVSFFQNSLFQEEEVQLNGDVGDKRFKDESPEFPDSETMKRDLDVELQAQFSKSEEQQEESSISIESQKTEVDTTRQLNGEKEDQSVADKLVQQDDLETELSKATIDVNEASYTQTFLDKKLQNASGICDNSGAICGGLQFEQESGENKEAEDGMEHIPMQLRTDLEITAASDKLAQCQETILNLGKQLKALAPTKASALSSKVTSNPAETVITSTPALDMKSPHHTTLLDKMLAEDKADIKVLRPANTRELIPHDHMNSAFSSDKTSKTLKRLTDTIRPDKGKSAAAVSSSGKKRSGLLMKLFCSERRSSCKQVDVMKS